MRGPSVAICLCLATLVLLLSVGCSRVCATACDATEVRGAVDFWATEYGSDALLGTIRGTFVADVVDRSDYTGGWPL